MQRAVTFGVDMQARVADCHQSRDSAQGMHIGTQAGQHLKLPSPGLTSTGFCVALLMSLRASTRAAVQLGLVLRQPVSLHINTPCVKHDGHPS